MAARKQNEELNSIMGWIPITVGAKMDIFYEAFAPRLEGVYGALSVLGLGGETRIANRSTDLRTPRHTQSVQQALE
jgi:hypothetical protein